MARTFQRLLLILLLCLTLSSCAGTKSVIVQQVPEGSVVVDKEALGRLLDSCEQCKQELFDCLNQKTPL